jgi:outer membrane protein TolC
MKKTSAPAVRFEGSIVRLSASPAKGVLGLPILVFIGGLCFAGETLSLERVRDLALANSGSLARYELAVSGNRWEEKTQAYAGLPSSSLGISASANLWNPPDGQEQNLQDQNLQDRLNAGANFSVSQKIFDWGKNSLLKSIAAITTGITRQEALGEYFAVLDAADAAYYACLEAAAALDAANSSLKTAELSLSMAEVRRENGMINAGDYLQALAEKEAGETAQNQAKRDLALNKVKLKNLTGLKELPALETVNFETYEELLLKLAGFKEGEIDALYRILWEAVLAKNPSLAKAALVNKRAGASVDIAGKDYLPTLNTSFATGLNYTPAGGLEISSGRLSFSSSIPLDFWVIGANVEKTKIARQQAALDYRNSEETLNIELQTALLDLIAQAGTTLSSRRAYEYAQKHFEYVMELYRLSQNSLSDLSGAEVLVRSNHSQLIRAQYAFLRGFSNLRNLGAFESEKEIETLILSGSFR